MSREKPLCEELEAILPLGWTPRELDSMNSAVTWLQEIWLSVSRTDSGTFGILVSKPSHGTQLREVTSLSDVKSTIWEMLRRLPGFAPSEL